jgi:large subunit ribosomal protein L24
MNIKKNDTVVIITGSDRGKKGLVVDILPKKGKVKVQGVALVARHTKARRQGEKSAIKQQERFIDISNVKKI